MATYTLRKVGEQELVFMQYEHAEKILKNQEEIAPTCERICPLVNTKACAEADCQGGYFIKKSLFVHHKLTGEKL